jgi:hypothetical protein
LDPDLSSVTPDAGGAIDSGSLGIDAAGDAGVDDAASSVSDDAGVLGLRVLATFSAEDQMGAGGAFGSVSVDGGTLLVAVVSDAVPTSVKAANISLSEVARSVTRLRTSLWRTPKGVSLTSVSDYSVAWATSQLAVAGLLVHVPAVLGDSGGSALTSGELQPATGTLEVSPSLLIAVAGVKAATPFQPQAPTNGFTALSSASTAGMGVVMAHKLTRAAAPAQSTGWTINGSSQWDALLVAFPAP